MTREELIEEIGRLFEGALEEQGLSLDMIGEIIDVQDVGLDDDGCHLFSVEYQLKEGLS